MDVLRHQQGKEESIRAFVFGGPTTSIPFHPNTTCELLYPTDRYTEQVLT
jgi:hypothetical protein